MKRKIAALLLCLSLLTGLLPIAAAEDQASPVQGEVGSPAANPEGLLGVVSDLVGHEDPVAPSEEGDESLPLRGEGAEQSEATVGIRSPLETGVTDCHDRSADRSRNDEEAEAQASPVQGEVGSPAANPEGLSAPIEEPTAALQATSGTCGDNLEWSFDTATGELTISGTGAMTSYPWISFCDSIKTVIIEDGVTTIIGNAFANCYRLESVTIPSSVTIIDYGAFNNCCNLSYNTYDNANYLGSTSNPHLYLASVSDYSIRSCVIHPDTKIVEGFVFSQCYNLQYNTYENAKYLGSTSNPYLYLDSLEESNVQNVTIHPETRIIGCGALYGCTMKTLTIPDSVISIQEDAAQDCRNLETVSIGSGLKSIAINVFYMCEKLTTFTVSGSNQNFCAQDGVLLSKDKTKLIVYPGGKSGSYTTPDSVTTIGEGAFAGCRGLTEITLSASVTFIENYAFIDCGNLSAVYLGKNVQTIGERAFEMDVALTNFQVSTENPKFSAKDGVLFNKDQTELLLFPGGKGDAYTIPNSVTTIGDYAFTLCANLTSVTIPDSVTTIGDFAFYICYSLTDVYYIGSEAQWDQIVIGDGNYSLYDADIHWEVCGETNLPIGDVTLCDSIKDGNRQWQIIITPSTELQRNDAWIAVALYKDHRMVDVVTESYTKGQTSLTLTTSAGKEFDRLSIFALDPSDQSTPILPVSSVYVDEIAANYASEFAANDQMVLFKVNATLNSSCSADPLKKTIDYPDGFYEVRAIVNGEIKNVKVVPSVYHTLCTSNISTFSGGYSFVDDSTVDQYGVYSDIALYDPDSYFEPDGTNTYQIINPIDPAQYDGYKDGVLYADQGIRAEADTPVFVFNINDGSFLKTDLYSYSPCLGYGDTHTDTGVVGGYYTLNVAAARADNMKVDAVYLIVKD